MLTLTVGHRESAAAVSWDLPPLAPGATSLLDVTATGCRQGDVAYAALASSTRVIEFAAAWTSNMVRMMARNISPNVIFDLGAATLPSRSLNGGCRSRTFRDSVSP
jgi:hypothetical protein